MSQPEPRKPTHIRELTPRSVAVGLLVALVIGASYPYVVLKFGFGPNISVVSAFFGYLALGIAFRNFHRWENNIVQTAGTSAGQTAFLCTLMAAFDFLRMDPAAHFTFVLQPHQAFLWLTCSGVLGGSSSWATVPFSTFRSTRCRCLERSVDTRTRGC